jgi:hypothetical protein
VGTAPAAGWLGRRGRWSATVAVRVPKMMSTLVTAGARSSVPLSVSGFVDDDEALLHCSCCIASICTGMHRNYGDDAKDTF